MDRKVALAFLAHPDDAEMASTGTLIRLRELGWEIHIATVTGGDLGNVDEVPADSVKTRMAEATRAADVIGATYHCLQEPDGRVVYDRPALDKTIDLFRTVAPSLVIAHPPIDYHRDHEVSHQLARCGSFIYAAPHASTLPLVAGSGVPHLYYQYVDLEDNAVGVNVPPTTVVDVAGQMEQRKQMLSKHVSQERWLQAHHGAADLIGPMVDRAARYGKRFGIDFAEPFIQHRGRPYPQNDILAELLGNVAQ